MRKYIVSFIYVLAFFARHGYMPSREITEFMVSTQEVEPWAYIPGNVWRWAEYEPNEPEQVDMPEWVFFDESDDDIII